VTEYLTAPIEVDQLDVLQLAYDYIQTFFPNWVPAEGNLDVAILEAISTDAAALRELASSIPDTIFRFFGATVVQIPPIDATPAISSATFTAIDSAGYTIPAGTQLAIAATGDTSITFETLVDAIIAPGSTTVSGVSIQAVDPGADGTSLGAPGEAITLIDSLAFVTAVTLDNETEGGQDAEDDDTYLDRLVGEMQLLSPRLIIPSDFAQDARNISGVTRAIAIDGYNPADGTFDNPRTIAISAVDAVGAAVDTSHKSAIQADVEAKREVNFIVNVIDPNYTEIDVTFDVIALPGFDTGAILSAIETAVTDWLQPYSWGQDQTVRDASAANTWVETDTLRYNDLVFVVRSVLGVAYINTLTVAKHGDAPGTIDLSLTSPAALTQPGTITGTVE
jgi:uncharacterized phage protein gp47/JayE